VHSITKCDHGTVISQCRCPAPNKTELRGPCPSHCPYKPKEGGSQPAPIPQPNQPAIQDLVIADIEKRKQLGLARYGTLLKPFNGRDALVDAYEEALDLCMYLKQRLVEEAGNG
jgi:hypothetical protein